MDKYQTLREKDNPTNNVYPNIKGANIPSSSITASKIASNAVTTSKIADSNVTESKLAPNSVTTGKIVSGAISTDKIANEAVTWAKIANGSITNEKIDPASISANSLNIIREKLSDVLEDVTTIADLYTALRELIRKPLVRFFEDTGNESATMEFSAFSLLGAYSIKYAIGGGTQTTLAADSDIPSFLLSAQDFYVEYIYA